MKQLKAFLAAIGVFILAFTFAACGTNGGGDANSDEYVGSVTDDGESKPTGGGSQDNSDGETETKILVVYFSATNNTENVAQKIQTAADLNYSTDCRANREQNDPSARPAISGSVENMSEYGAVFIGYPIWWGTLPKIIYTFLDSYDLSGKTLVPFCTSGGSGITTSVNAIKQAEPSATVLEGRRFSSGVSRSVINSWVSKLGL